jgi:bifunctional non-homologous end joining protein LigD
VLYTFDLPMLRGQDVRSWPLEERCGRLLEIAQHFSSTIRYSEGFEVRLADLISVVRQHGVEGIVAKRARSPYRSGERSGDWLSGGQIAVRKLNLQPLGQTELARR